MVSIRRAYDEPAEVARHPLPGGVVAALVAVVAVAAHTRGAWAPVAVAVAVAAMVGAVGARRDRYPWRVIVIAVLLGVVGADRADHAWAALAPDRVGAFEGWVTVVGDPQPYGRATRVVVEVEGERFEWWVRGRARQLRVASWSSGDRFDVSLVRAPLRPDRAERVAWEHVVGAVEVDWVADGAAGRRSDTASNRVRALLARGAAALPSPDDALLRGLVIGDDRDQPQEMIDRFRASGLSHLTAVSGQNVAFVLAAAGPALRRLRPGPRWLVTLGLIAWFAALTRFEPSIVRAGTMAALSATAFALGRQRSPARILGLAVLVLLLVDPLLVRSVGFWLSAGATAGVTMVGPPLAARLSVLGPLATPIGITLGAQAGVVLPALLVFGRLPLVSVPANLLAVPVAGAVMLYGLPAGLVAGALPPAAPLVMFPCRLGVRWVDTVATVGARLEPSPTVAWAGWIVLVAVVGVVVTVGAGKNRDPHGGAPPHR